MTAFFKANGDYTINGYTFTSAGLQFPDGSVQSSASTGSGGTSGPVSWTGILNRPTTLSAFTNDVGFITSASLTWNSITSKPTLFSGSYTDLSDKPGLAQVATSGSYNDLNFLPTIPTVPTALSSFTNDSGYITSSSLTWSSISGKPTSVSYFSNDAGYITSSSLTWDNVTNKPTNSQILNSEMLNPFLLMGV